MMFGKSVCADIPHVVGTFIGLHTHIVGTCFPYVDEKQVNVD